MSDLTVLSASWDLDIELVSVYLTLIFDSLFTINSPYYMSWSPQQNSNLIHTSLMHVAIMNDVSQNGQNAVFITATSYERYEASNHWQFDCWFQSF